MAFFRFFTFERQLILFVVAAISIVPLYLWNGFAGAWLSIILVIFLLIKHILIGTVNAAAMKMQEQDLEGAKKMLSYTWKPEWLRFTFHGMYYFVASSIEYQSKNWNEAERFAQKALSLDLQDDYKAMLYLQAMSQAGQRRNVPKMKELLKKCKQLNISQDMIKFQVEQAEQAIKGQHPDQKKMMGKKAQRSMMNQGYMGRRGSKGRKRK